MNNAFLEIEGIKGESTSAQGKDMIEILSFSHGVSMPLTAGSSLSPPIPMHPRTRAGSTAMPCSVNAFTHAEACASLLSTSVPSTSKRTAFKRLAISTANAT